MGLQQGMTACGQLCHARRVAQLGAGSIMVQSHAPPSAMQCHATCDSVASWQGILQPRRSERVWRVVGGWCLCCMQAGVRCSLEQMLEDGFYHADPVGGLL